MPFFQWLRTFDRDPAYISVNYQGRKVHRSKTGGCISMVFFISVMVLFVFKFYPMLKQQNVIFQTRLGKDDFDSLNLTNANIRLSVKNSSGNLIPCDQLQQYNLQVVLFWKKTLVSGQQNNGTQRLQPCKSNQTISINIKRQYNQNKSQLYQFCANNIYEMRVKGRNDVIKIPNEPLITRQNEQNTSEQEQDQITYQQFSVILRQIKVNQSSQINSVSVTPILKFNNHVINQEKKDISQAIYDLQQRIFSTNEPLTFNQNIVQYTLEMKKVVMITDYSIFPNAIQQILKFTASSTQQKSWFYGEQFTSQTYSKIEDKSDLFVASFKRSMYTNTYIRHFQKLDTVLAESFALSGLFSVISICLYKGYNSWSLQKQNLNHQRHLDEDSPLNSTQEQSVNILAFYRHQIKYLCVFISQSIANCLKHFKWYNCLKWLRNKLCRCFYKKEQIQERKSSFIKRKKLEQQLDIYRSRRQINYLKKRLLIFEQAIKKIGDRYPQVTQILNKNNEIKLSQGYNFTPSFIQSFTSSNDLLSKKSSELQTILNQNTQN